MGGHGQRRRRQNRGITEDVATGIGGLHKAADGLLWPLKPVDQVVHGVARGSFDWLTDRHSGHDASSDSDCDGPPPPRRKSHSSYTNGGGGYRSYTKCTSYGSGYPNTKQDVFTRNRGSQIGTVTTGGGHPHADYTSSDSDDNDAPPQRHPSNSQSPCFNKKRDVFVDNENTSFGTIKSHNGGRIRDCAKFTVN